MPVRYGSLPFAEAIAFFRQKLNMPSERWADVWRDAHNRAFMVAGATKTDLLADLRGAVDKAISEGQSLGAFQKAFKEIVARHGWEHTGPASWRSRVIFETNLRQSYNAGRDDQIERIKHKRPYALYRHGAREVERLVMPSSVGGAGARVRRLRREGAYIAWIFFMLFAMSIAAVMLALSLAGTDFETGVVLTVAALSNTGPLANVATASPIAYAPLGDGAKMILAAAMVLGRLETLAIIAMLNRDFWRA